ncbi:hypothetical protein J7T55_002837 [Diaporthe amygdali]|uniref:uncharacterized protein n=1 Tax=Phomopsis amygdali TaxID=1214568 RepID=UPI0022FF0B59|nr:uncharacterized protein J7T55_002837 [Diaporthe amygdali]KAJ0122324.1 hypothetical protein J7T55_002837 [Diaporthe amygdali]
MWPLASLLPLLAASVLAAPTPQADGTTCPTSSFALFFGPSLSDGREAYAWNDLTNWIRAITSLDIDTPERATFQVNNNRLFPISNSTIFATVANEGGVIEFHDSETTDRAAINAEVVPGTDGKCRLSLTAGTNKYISMQNYKGWMHLTSDPQYSSRWWGEGPFEMVPFPAAAPAVSTRQEE